MSLKRCLLALLVVLVGCKEPLVVESYLALVHLSPSPGAAGINVDTQVVASFSEPLVGSSIDAQTVWMEDVNQVPVVANVTYDGASSSIILTPETSLEINTTYRVFLTNKIEGANSGKLRANVTSDFTTGGWEPTNQLPVANAGEDVAGIVGQVVRFDGTDSTDPEAAALTYSWRIISTPPNSAAALEDTTSPAIEFTPDVVGEYVAGLIVNDGIEDSSEDFVLARVAPGSGDTDPPDTGTSDTGTSDTGTSDTGTSGASDTGG
jgi:hypothetical protein